MIISRRIAAGALAVAAALGAAACTPMNPTAGPSAQPSGSASASAGASIASPSASGGEPSASTSPSAGSSPSGVGTAACTTGDLKLGIAEASGGAAAGSNYLLITFRNTSSAPCTLYGWPGVSLVGDGNGTQLGAAAVRVDSGAQKTVTLQPGKQTTALLQVAQAGNYSSSACDPATADGFRIYVPNQKAAVFVKKSTPACRKSGAALLHISPVGTSG